MTDSKQIRSAAQKKLKAARKALAAAHAAEKAERDSSDGMAADLLASILHGTPCVDAVGDAEKALAAAEAEAAEVERVIAGRGRRARLAFMAVHGDKYGPF